ncbi:MAG: hypothetical protein HDT43_10525 [Ruminococcaceae bacterium]|nr:hypothetical protein [Oscillospiraceae bacterium]
MNKLRLAGIILGIVAIIAFIPLTIEIFGDMNTDIITVSALFVGVGLIGSCICSFIRGMLEYKKK